MHADKNDDNPNNRCPFKCKNNSKLTTNRTIGLCLRAGMRRVRTTTRELQLFPCSHTQYASEQRDNQPCAPVEALEESGRYDDPKSAETSHHQSADCTALQGSSRNGAYRNHRRFASIETFSPAPPRCSPGSTSLIEVTGIARL